MDISFNGKGVAVILRTTNAFGGNFDLLHVVNLSDLDRPRVHLIYTTPPQPIAGFSINSDGDLIAICPLGGQIISIVRLYLGVEIYRIDPQKLDMSPFVGMTFVPGGSTLMTAHKTGYAVFWDVNRLVQTNTERVLDNSHVAWNTELTYISATGNTVALASAIKCSLPLILHIDPHGNLQTLRIQLPFFDRQCESFPQGLADYGTSILVGRYVCFLGDKFNRRKLSIPTKAKIGQCTQTYDKKIALALLQGKQWTVRVFDPASSSYRTRDWAVPSSGITNIWGLAFDGHDEVLGVGVQQGANLYSVHFLTKRLSLLGTVFLPDGNVPVKMAFRKNSEFIVLACGWDKIRTAVRYSAIWMAVPSDTKNTVVASTLPISSWMTVPPTLTSQGEVYYLGMEKYDGWIMRVDKDTRDGRSDSDDDRIAWCPMSWQNIGTLSLLGASKGEFATVVCMNKVLGITVIKATK